MILYTEHVYKKKNALKRYVPLMATAPQLKDSPAVAMTT